VLLDVHQNAQEALFVKTQRGLLGRNTHHAYTSIRFG